MWMMIRYKIKPDQLERQLDLHRAVYEELESVSPDGMREVTFQLEDGVSFIGLVEAGEIPPSIEKMEAFQRYREDLLNRCEEPPVRTMMQESGSFRFH
jgi:hypothetical protein